MTIIKTIIILIVFYNFCHSLVAQSFLYNPGFEPIQKDFDIEYDKSDPSDWKYAKGCRCCLQSWRINNNHSRLKDWNEKYWSIAEIYNNPLSDPKCHPTKVFGKSYATITVWAYDEEGKLRPINPKSDYLETKLKRPLIKGRKYNVSFQVALSRYLTINNLGILFTEKPIDLDTIRIINIPAQIVMETIIDTSGEYALFQDEFIADREFNYLTLGFFPSGQTIQTIHNPERLPRMISDIDLTEMNKHPAFSFQIDEIQIFEILDHSNLQNEIAKWINVKNILFETNKAILSSIGRNEIDKLAKLMEELPYLKIKIEGHTDDEGEVDFNLELSNRRANEILNYLHKKGIEKSRLEAIGFGELIPLLPNTSAENRLVNRRVEIKVINH